MSVTFLDIAVKPRMEALLTLFTSDPHAACGLYEIRLLFSDFRHVWKSWQSTLARAIQP